MNIFAFDRTIRIRMVLQFVTNLTVMSVMPYLIVFFSSQLGTAVTGMMFIAVMAASILGTFAGGYAADRIGRKKVIVTCEAIILAGFSAVAWVNAPGYQLPYATFGLFVLIQLCSGAAGPVYQALIIDVSRPDNRRAIFTALYWINNLAGAAGGMIGAFLFKGHHFWLFVGVAGSTAISLLITILFIGETYVPQSRSQSQPGKKAAQTKDGEGRNFSRMLTAYGSVVRHKWFMRFALASLLIIAVEEQLTNVIGIRLVKELAEPQALLPFLSFQVDGMNMLGILRSENTMLVVCLTGVVSLMMRKYKDRARLLWGLALFFSGYAVISYSASPGLLLFAMLVATIGELMHIPAKQTMLANMVPDDARSTYMAVYSLLNIAGVSSAGVFILISSWVPPLLLSIGFACMGAVSVGMFAVITKRLAKETEASVAPIQTGA
ncbi:arabinose ABC transporter permease [Brevibacillus parabrevis]|uniref:MFS transporter n=1 Tax=Brevibacillus parabrevis TaxID=54914 RepID=UPI0007AB9225|nr:MFS transporter [Brevibacillus parabrevis]KZE52285.1 arabinose ABC transporter permease [Brevibacillus parabrevis]